MAHLLSRVILPSLSSRTRYSCVGRLIHGVIPRDPYEVLGISREASQKDIKLAFYARAKELHPDTSKKPNAHQDFLELAAAFSILSEQDYKAAEQNWERYPDPDGTRAKWYYDNVSTELHGSNGKQVQHAACLEEGGPDWGGMWEMARMMRAEEIAADDERPRSIEGGARKELTE